MELQTSQSRINENGRIVIPSSFRKVLGIKPGDTLVMRIENNELRIATLRQRLEWAQKAIRQHVPRSTSLAGELIADRRKAARRE